MKAVAEEVLELLQLAPLRLNRLQHSLLVGIVSVPPDEVRQPAEVTVLENRGRPIHQDRDLDSSHSRDGKRDLGFI